MITLETLSAKTVTLASGTLRSTNTNVSNGDTVTIGDHTYTFRTSLSSPGPSTEAYAVLIGADADASLLNLIRAINGSGTPGTHYGSSTPENEQVTAATSVTSHAFAVTARSGALSAIETTDTAAQLYWDAATLAGGTVALTFAVGEVALAQPGQQVSVVNAPDDDSRWIRTLRLTDAGLYCLRNGVDGVALSASEWAKAVAAVNPEMTPVTDPEAASCVQSSTTAIFTVALSSELAAASYAWQYSANGLNGWTAASGTVNGCAYTNNTTATLTCTPTTTGQSGYYHRCLVTVTGVGVVVSGSAVLTIT